MDQMRDRAIAAAARTWLGFANDGFQNVSLDTQDRRSAHLRDHPRLQAMTDAVLAAVEPDIRADERAKWEPTLLEANATIWWAMDTLGSDHPVWIILDDYDGSMDNVEAIRADERRRVREELLAIAEEEKAAQVAYFRIHGHVGAYHLTAEEIADRIAPEGGDRG